MRSVGNFYPEWGHLAAPSTLRHSLFVTSVALAVGATASAAVMLSLVDSSAMQPRIVSTSAQTLVTKAEASGASTTTQDLPTAVEKNPPPAITGTIHDDAVTTAPTDAGHRAAVHIGRKAREHRRVVIQRRKTHRWQFARGFAPFPRDRSW
jgi:hypothetical protein